MAVKKSKTVKELSTEVESLSRLVQDLQKELKSVKQNLFSKIENAKRNVTNVNSPKKQNPPKKKDGNVKQFECDNCETKMNTRVDLEIHISEQHSDKRYECHECDLEFFTEWRLKKHEESHKFKVKNCHYFNNGKICPFEKIGCKFLHKNSALCRFGNGCQIKMCQFKHAHLEEVENDNDDIDEIAKALEKEDWNEFEEAEKLVCDHYCDEVNGYHLHFDDLYHRFFGVDTAEIDEHNDSITREQTMTYPCKFCDFSSHKLEDHKNHIQSNHEDQDKNVFCVFKECEYKSVFLGKLVKCILVKHNKYIKKKLGNV